MKVVPSMYVMGGLLPVSFLAMTLVQNASALSFVTSPLRCHSDTPAPYR